MFVTAFTALWAAALVVLAVGTLRLVVHTALGAFLLLEDARIGRIAPHGAPAGPVPRAAARAPSRKGASSLRLAMAADSRRVA
jgi:hypothetical protein